MLISLSMAVHVCLCVLMKACLDFQGFRLPWGTLGITSVPCIQPLFVESNLRTRHRAGLWDTAGHEPCECHDQT